MSKNWYFRRENSLTYFHGIFGQKLVFCSSVFCPLFDRVILKGGHEKTFFRTLAIVKDWCDDLNFKYGWPWFSTMSHTSQNQPLKIMLKVDGSFFPLFWQWLNENQKIAQLSFFGYFFFLIGTSLILMTSNGSWLESPELKMSK